MLQNPGLPPDALGVYLPGKLREGNCLAYSSTTTAMNSENFVSVAGANWNGLVN